jgi:hypothetical protein
LPAHQIAQIEASIAPIVTTNANTPSIIPPDVLNATARAQLG